MNPDRPTAESKSYSPNILLQQRVEQLLSAPIDQCFQNNTDGANFIATLHYVDCILQKENNNSNADFRFLLEQEQLQNHKMLLKTVSDMYQECITTSESLASLVRNVDRVESLLFTSQTNKEEEIKKQSEFAAKIKVLSGALKQSETEKVQVEQFQEKYNFGEEDQEKIEKDRVSPSYLALYEKLEVIYEQSKDQLLRPTAENNNNTTTFLETAFGALRMARERIRQYVLDATMYNTDGVNITADLPHLPPLYTRCVVLLKKYEKERIEQELLEETNFLENNNHNNYPEKKKVEVSVLQSKSPLQRIIEEVIKQRKKTVLRRFFQLLMTGVTSTGTSLQNDENENNTIKPLETEIDHPVTFFSELFAFVYQTAVTEEDFMALYTRDDNPNDMSLSIWDRKVILSAIFESLFAQLKKTIVQVLERLETNGRNFLLSTNPNNNDNNNNTNNNNTVMERAKKIGGFFKNALSGQKQNNHHNDGLTENPNLRRLLSGNIPTSDNFKQIIMQYGNSNGLIQYNKTTFQLVQLFYYYRQTMLHSFFEPLETNPNQSFVYFVEKDILSVKLMNIFQNTSKDLLCHALDSVLYTIQYQQTLWRRVIHKRTNNNNNNENEKEKEDAFVLQYLIHYSYFLDESHNTNNNSLRIENSLTSLSNHNNNNNNNNSTIVEPQQQKFYYLEIVKLYTKIIIPPSPEFKEIMEYLLQYYMTQAKAQNEQLEAFSENENNNNEKNKNEINNNNNNCVTTLIQNIMTIVTTLIHKNNTQPSFFLFFHATDSFIRTLMVFNILLRLYTVLQNNNNHHNETVPIIMKTLNEKLKFLEETIITDCVSAFQQHNSHENNNKDSFPLLDALLSIENNNNNNNKENEHRLAIRHKIMAQLSSPKS